MMLATNFHIFHRGGKLHLAPLWDVLVKQHPPEVLVGIFLKFEDVGRELRMPVELPDHINALPEHEKRLHVFRATGGDPSQSWEDPSGLTPLSELDSINSG